MAFGDFTVTRASTKNVIGSNGLYQSVANNVPAFEFNANGSYRGLLVEPGATNLVLHNRDFADAYWTKAKTTVVTDSAVGLFGDADLVHPNANDTGDFEVAIKRFTSSLASAARTVSFFIKPSGWRWVYVLDAGGAQRVWFDLQNGVLGTQQGTTVGKITEQPDGWYRIEVFRSSSQTSFYCWLGFSDADNSTVCTASGTNGVLLDIAQMETGAVATSPIVTTGSTASRVADVVTLTGASSLIGQTAGTIFFDGFIEKRNDSAFALAISNGASLSEAIYIQQATSGNISGLIRSGGNTLNLTFLSANWTAGRAKVAVVYEAGTNKCVICVNGGTPVKGTATAIPTCGIVTIGSRADSPGGLAITNAVGTVALFPTPLTDAQIIALTTL